MNSFPGQPGFAGYRKNLEVTRTSALDHYTRMHPTLGNVTCIFFLLLWRREERKSPLWVRAGTYLGLKVGREGRSGPFSSGRILGRGSCVTQTGQFNLSDEKASATK